MNTENDKQPETAVRCTSVMDEEWAALTTARKHALAALHAGDETEYEKWMPTVRRLAKKLDPRPRPSSIETRSTTARQQPAATKGDL